MLQLIRDKAQGIVMWVIIILVILALSGFVLSSYTASNVKNYVVKVNDREITTSEFQRAYNNYAQRLQQSLGENYSRFFNEEMMRESVMSGMIENELMAQLTNEAGFRVSAGRIYNQIQSNPAFQDETGKFSKEKYTETLTQYFGFGPEYYESELAKGLAQEQLRNGIVNTAFALQSELIELERLNTQQRDVGFLSVNRAKVNNAITVSDAEISSYYAAHKSEYMTDEQIKVAYIELNLKDISQQIQIADDEISKYYQENIARYSLAEERKASHILIKINEQTSSDAATQKLLDIKKSLAEGKSFAELAKEFSEDRGTALNGGSLDFITKGSTGNPPFEDAVYALKVGEVSEPVQSQFGFHLIRLDEIRAGKTKPLADVKEKIRNELQIQHAERRFYTDADTLDKLAYEHQGALEPAAEQLNLQIKESPYFSRLGGPQIWRNQKVLAAAFSQPVLHEGINSEMIELADDHLIVFRAKDVKAAEQKTLEQVKAQIHTRLMQEKLSTAITEQTTALYEKIKAGEDPQALAAGNDAIHWNNAGYIVREAKQTDAKEPQAQISPDVRKAIFELAKPAKDKPVIHKMTAASGDGVVVVLRDVRDNPETPAHTPEFEAKQRQIMDVNAQMSERAVIDYLRANSKIDINIEKQTETE